MIGIRLVCLGKELEASSSRAGSSNDTEEENVLSQKSSKSGEQMD